MITTHTARPITTMFTKHLLAILAPCEPPPAARSQNDAASTRSAAARRRPARDKSGVAVESPALPRDSIPPHTTRSFHSAARRRPATYKLRDVGIVINRCGQALPVVAILPSSNKAAWTRDDQGLDLRRPIPIQFQPQALLSAGSSSVDPTLYKLPRGARPALRPQSTLSRRPPKSVLHTSSHCLHLN